MAWTEQSPGTWKSPLSPLELVYFRLYSQAPSKNGRENLLICPCLKLDFSGVDDDPIISLEEAWKALRFEFPALACTLQDQCKIYQVPIGQGLQAWCDESFIVREDEESSMSFAEPPKTPHALLVYYPQTSEIMLRMSHWQTDQMGALRILNRFLAIYVEQTWRHRTIAWGEEVTRLNIGFDQGLASTVTSTDEAKGFVAGMLGDVMAAGPSLACGYKGTETDAEGDPGTFILSLSESDSKDVFTACKDSGHTVTTALHAALVTASYQFTETKDRAYVSIVLHDLRRYASGDMSSDAYATTPAVTATLLTVRLEDAQASTNSAFAEAEKAVLHHYKTSFCGKQVWLEALEEMINFFKQVVDSPPPAGASPPSTPFLSSVGIIEKTLSREYTSSNGGRVLRVEDVILRIGLNTRELAIYPYTFRGALRIGCMFNKAFYDTAYVKGFLHRIVELLQGRFNVGLNQIQESQ